MTRITIINERCPETFPARYVFSALLVVCGDMSSVMGGVCVDGCYVGAGWLLWGVWITWMK